MAGTGQPGRWIAGVQPWQPVRYDNSAQPTKLYLATYTPTTIDGNTFNYADLKPVPVAPMRASQLINGTAEGSSARQLAVGTVADYGTAGSTAAVRGCSPHGPER